MSMAWEPDRRSNFFFSPPAHLCAVTYVTEISLIVTLNNQFNSTLDIFDINVFYFICLGITFYDLSDLVDCWSSFSIRRIIYKFLLMCVLLITWLLMLVGRLGSRKPV